MELKANENKKIEIAVDGEIYSRYAIQTHFVQIEEDYIELVKKYVGPFYQEGDILSISEKIIALCQKRIIYKEDVKVSLLARFLSRFAMRSDAGIGVDSPYKMQYTINICGRAKVIYAAILSGIGKLFKKRGIFYSIVGQEVSGLDGFYGNVFPEYAHFGIMIPENPSGVCDEIYEKTGIRAMIVDANDLNVDILGKAAAVDKDEDFLRRVIIDNPAGQSKQLTPFIIIRKKSEKRVDYQGMKSLLSGIPEDTRTIVACREGADTGSIYSALALTRFLNKIGKKAVMPLEEKEPELLKGFDDYSYIKTDSDIPEDDYALILVDTPDKSDLGDFEKYFDNAELSVSINRYEDAEGEAKHILYTPEMSSISEAVFTLMELFDEEIDRETAGLLYAGLVADTLSFTQKTTPETFEAAASLLRQSK